jgi:DNA-binding Xre family transcriptional regulator
MSGSQPRSVCTRIGTNPRRIRFDTLVAICQVLDRQPGYLLGAVVQPG